MATDAFDLNRLVSMQVLALEPGGPLAIRLVPMPRRTPTRSPSNTSVALRPVKPATPEPDDLPSTTWEDAEWQ